MSIVTKMQEDIAYLKSELEQLKKACIKPFPDKPTTQTSQTFGPILEDSVITIKPRKRRNYHLKTFRTFKKHLLNAEADWGDWPDPISITELSNMFVNKLTGGKLKVVTVYQMLKRLERLANEGHISMYPIYKNLDPDLYKCQFLIGDLIKWAKEEKFPLDKF